MTLLSRLKVFELFAHICSGHHSSVSDDISVGALQQKQLAADKAVFWFTWRVVLSDFLLERHTVNKECYCALFQLITTSNSWQLTRFAAKRCHSLKWQCPPCNVPIRQIRKLKRWAGNCYSICYTAQT